MSKRSKPLSWQPELLESWELLGVQDPVARHIETLQQYILELESFQVDEGERERIRDKAYREGYDDGLDEAEDANCDTCKGLLPTLRRFLEADREHELGIEIHRPAALAALREIARRYITF